MPDLLQTIADRNTSHLNDLTAAFEQEVHGLDAVPEPRRLCHSLTAARTIVREVSAAADAVEGWAADLEARLRQGMNGNAFRDLTEWGTQLMGACLALAGVAEHLWDRAAELGAAADDVTAGREAVSAAKGRMLAVKPQLDRWARLAHRERPEIDPALIEKGAEQIRQGKFKTAEEIQRSIRNRGG